MNSPQLPTYPPFFLFLKLFFFGHTWWCLEVTPDSLHLGITHGCAQVTLWDAGLELRSAAFNANALPTVLSLAPSILSKK